MWKSPFKLAKSGILGMNQRNLSYIGRYNKRHLFPLVDNKLKSKLLAQENNINVPELIAVIHEQHQINQVGELLKTLNGFAIKPSKGSGGKGILIIKAVEDGTFIKSSGQPLQIEQIERHLSNILAGLHSLGGSPDAAIIETLINPAPLLTDISFQGVPDIRIIVFCGYPVMAMIRCATSASDGKANLHQGAVGIGLNIHDGKAIAAIQFEEPLSHHPDTQASLHAVQIPDWDICLNMAARCYDMTNLGYMGVDLVLDEHSGPTLLELNARPGLAIQVANQQGLLPRLRLIESEKKNRRNAEERVAFSREHFNKLPVIPVTLKPVNSEAAVGEEQNR